MKNCAIYEKLLSRPLLIEEIDQEFARRSLREFVRQAWQLSSPQPSTSGGWHLDAITDTS